MKKAEFLSRKELGKPKNSLKKNVSLSRMKVANLLTICRIVLSPLIFVLILWKIWVPATILLAVAFATDLADGYIARKFKQRTKTGKILDPIADKILAFSAIVPLLFVFGDAATNLIYGIMFFSKDIFNFFFLVLTRTVKIKNAKPRMLGKITTFAQGVAIFWIILRIPHYEILIWIVFILGIASGIDYYIACKQNLKKQR